MKKVVIFIIFAVIFFSFALCVSAGPNINDITGQVAQQGGYQTAGVTDTSLSQTIGKIIQVALGLTGTVFLALTVYAGFLWMTAGGNEEHVKKATDILKTSVIGIVIILAAYSVTYFVMGYILGATTPGNMVGGTGSGWYGGGDYTQQCNRLNPNQEQGCCEKDDSYSRPYFHLGLCTRQGTGSWANTTGCCDNN